MHLPCRDTYTNNPGDRRDRAGIKDEFQLNTRVKTTPAMAGNPRNQLVKIEGQFGLGKSCCGSMNTYLLTFVFFFDRGEVLLSAITALNQRWS